MQRWSAETTGREEVARVTRNGGVAGDTLEEGVTYGTAQWIDRCATIMVVLAYARSFSSALFLRFVGFIGHGTSHAQDNTPHSPSFGVWNILLPRCPGLFLGQLQSLSNAVCLRKLSAQKIHTSLLAFQICQLEIEVKFDEHTKYRSVLIKSTVF